MIRYGDASVMATRGDILTYISTEMDSSSRSSSELSLRYSSSLFEGHSSPRSEADLGEERTIEPYMYEPYREEESTSSSDEESRTDMYYIQAIQIYWLGRSMCVTLPSCTVNKIRVFSQLMVNTQDSSIHHYLSLLFLV